MVAIAHHIILTGYGHWLPNDPRGSMSDEVHVPKIAELGPAHQGRKPVQPPPSELRAFHKAAKERLALPVLWWNDADRQALADALGGVVTAHGLTCYMCAVLRDHVHLLLRRHRLRGDQMISTMKDAGREALVAQGIAPEGHPVFIADSCDVYKRTPVEVRGCVNYIWLNYSKHKLSPASCSWVCRYDGWPFHNKGPTAPTSKL